MLRPLFDLFPARSILRLLVGLLTLLAVASPVAAEPGDDSVLRAREALRKQDRAQLATARMAVNTAGHSLAMWVEYWELANRLNEAQQPELESFYQRWPRSYVEDRLRNDWLLELGRRRDWANLRAGYPLFRMNDDREVTCYALLAQHLDGQDVLAPARATWLSSRDLDDGCALLGRTLFDARLVKADDAWQQARQAAEFNRPRVARLAAGLINPAHALAVTELWDSPSRYLARRPETSAASGHELGLLGLMRLAASDPEVAAGQIEAVWSQRLPIAMTATAWAHVGKQAALKHMPQAVDYSRRAWQLWDAATRAGTAPPWGDDLLAWQVRAALRKPANDKQRWPLMERAIDAMSPSEQRDSTWIYWKARATQAQAKAGTEGEGARASARLALESIAPELSFYGNLATEDLGNSILLPPKPAPPTATERGATRAHPGLTRALQLIALGLRGEGVREWNFSLRGMADRELLAAAQWACEREVWDRCINTSDRTRAEVDMAQRFPMPFRSQVLAKSRAAGLDAAVLYGLIRQESRFLLDARSGVGASGLMQLMPATARWTAQKIGLDYRAEMIADRDVNLLLGATYLKRVLDDFSGSLAMATAAYNAGPGRPRRWREGGAVMEPAAWAETIPFTETRDYVKKVLSNSVYYAALLAAPDAAGGGAQSLAQGSGSVTLKSRLGMPIGPREPGLQMPDRELP